jgi:hypothetical protein
VGGTVELHLGVWEDTLCAGSGAVTGNGGSKSKIGDLIPHLELIDLVFVMLFVRGALHHQALLLHALAHQWVLSLKCGLPRGEAGGGGGHGFSMPRLPLRLEVGNDLLELCFGLGAVVRSLGPKLGELVGVATHLSIRLTGKLGELGPSSQHRSFRRTNGSLRGGLGGSNSRVQPRALGL